MRNNKGETPADMFYSSRENVLQDIREETKAIANSGMVVAALIATIVFAAALIVPGDKGDKWFDVFFVANAVALFTASASIIYFLAVFSSSWSRRNKFFVTWLPGLSIHYSLLLLCVSTIAMLVAFIAASFLIYEGKSKNIAYFVISLEIFPIVALVFLLSSAFDFLFLATWSSL